jgi:hypothetical protein
MPERTPSHTCHGHTLDGQTNLAQPRHNRMYESYEVESTRKARSDRIALFTLVLLTFGSQLERGA